MNIESYIVIGLILLLIFGGMAFVIFRRFFRRAWYGSGFIGQNVWYHFRPKDKQDAIEEVYYMEEDEKDEDFGADKFK